MQDSIRKRRIKETNRCIVHIHITSNTRVAQLAEELALALERLEMKVTPVRCEVGAHRDTARNKSSPLWGLLACFDDVESPDLETSSLTSHFGCSVHLLRHSLLCIHKNCGQFPSLYSLPNCLAHDIPLVAY